MNGNGRESLAWMQEKLRRLKEKAQYRELQRAEAADEEGWIVKNGVKMLNLASNHYLGLPAASLSVQHDAHGTASPDPGVGAIRPEQAPAPSLAGATASRLIVGNHPVFGEFEQDFAAFKGAEASLLFSSGYMANVGILSAVMGRGDLVFSDRLNHASIVDGIVLSRADHHRYAHRDLDRLERQLRQADPDRRKLIVTDAVFSMDGTVAPLRDLVELKDRYGAMLMVDEAHSGGIYGPNGEGMVHELGLQDRVEIQMGTFSKAYGGYGAYAAGDRVLIDYLINHARSFIFTTALPPAVVAAVRDNWRLAVKEGWRRRRLRELSAWFRRELTSLGFDTGGSETQIVPLIVGGNADTVAFAEALQRRGIAAVAVRPPTVPEGAARIRFALMATHREADLRWAIGVIAEEGRSVGII